MPDFANISRGGRHPTAPMSLNFQQRHVDLQSSHTVAQQPPLRPVSQPTGRLQQQRPCSDLESPQSQQSYLSFQDPEPQSHHDISPDESSSFIEIPDLTATNFTENVYFQCLSIPITVRFEKIEPRTKHDSAGERLESTWLHCTRRLPNVDATQAAKEIQRLDRRDNKKGLTLTKKQQSLGPNAKTQLAKAERDLSAAVQDHRFHIVLKQLDWTEKSGCEPYGKESKRHPRKKSQKERTSITAYFSRCPKPNQVPSVLYRQLEIERLHVQTQLDEQRLEREMMMAHTVHEDRAEDKKEYGEELAEHKIRQTEATANMVHNQRVMFHHHQQQQKEQQQHQQRSTSQSIPLVQPVKPSDHVFDPQGRAYVPQHQPGAGRHEPAQGHPPMPAQQAGPLPQESTKGRLSMARQPRRVPQQPVGFQINNQSQQGRPEQPCSIQGTPPAPPPPEFRQMAPQQRPPQNFRQMTTVRDFVCRPTHNKHPKITVVAEHEEQRKHRQGHSRHSSCSSGSGSSFHSVFDSDLERCSAGTRRSPLASGFTESPSMMRILPIKSKMAKGGARLRYTADSDVDFVRERRPPNTQRHEKAHTQTVRETKIGVPGLSPRGPSVDPLAQVREAYLAGHADHERLTSKAERLGASGTKHHPPRRLARREMLSEADRLDRLPSKYRFRRLPCSVTHSKHASKIFHDGDVPRIRRMSMSEVGRELNQGQAQDLAGGFFPRWRAGGRDCGLRHNERDLENDLIAGAWIGDERLEYRPCRYDDLGLVSFRERQRQRELFAINEHEEILRGAWREW